MNKILLSSLLLLIAFASCRKPEVSKPDKKKNLSTVMTVTAPTVSDGMLVFTDEEHYAEWLEYLYESTRRDSTDNDTTSTEEILDGIEDGLSFNSLRKSLRQEFDELNEVGWSQLEDIPVMHFIGDQAELSTLNLAGEVKIGNNIIIHYSKDYDIIITDDDFLDDVRTFLGGNPGDLMDMFFLTEIPACVVDIQQKWFSRDNGPCAGTTSKSSGATGSVIWGRLSYDDCNNKIVYLDNYAVSENGAANCNWDIDWGDGSSHTIVTATHVLKNVSHTYSTIATYNVKIKATSLATNSNYSMNESAVLTASCAKGSKYTDYIWANDGTWAVRTYVGVTNTTNKKKIYASSESFKKDGNNWVSRKADRLRVEACMEVLNGTCGTWYNKCGVTEHKTDRMVQDGFTISADFGYNVAYGFHKLKEGSHTVTYTNSVNPCE